MSHKPAHPAHNNFRNKESVRRLWHVSRSPLAQLLLRRCACRCRLNIYLGTHLPRLSPLGLCLPPPLLFISISSLLRVITAISEMCRIRIFSINMSWKGWITTKQQWWLRARVCTTKWTTHQLEPTSLPRRLRYRLHRSSQSSPICHASFVP